MNMSRILKSLLAAFGSAGLVSAAQADPGETISKLLNARLNWFTYGLAELGERMERLAFEVTNTEVDQAAPVFGGARYDQKANRITLYIRGLPVKDKSEPESECRRMLETIRLRGGINANTGQVRETLDYSLYASEFISEGFPLSHIGREDGKTLDSIMSVEIEVVGFGGKPILICQAPLVGSGNMTVVSE
jgi:hypothetical protein